MEDDSTRYEAEQELGRIQLEEALQFFQMAVGAVETVMVALRGGWTEQERNVDCRLMLERVLYARRHPDAPKPKPVPPLVQAAVDYCQDATPENLSRLEGFVELAQQLAMQEAAAKSDEQTVAMAKELESSSDEGG